MDKFTIVTTIISLILAAIQVLPIVNKKPSTLEENHSTKNSSISTENKSDYFFRFGGIKIHKVALAQGILIFAGVIIIFPILKQFKGAPLNIDMLNRTQYGNMLISLGLFILSWRIGIYKDE